LTPTTKKTLIFAKELGNDKERSEADDPRVTKRLSRYKGKVGDNKTKKTKKQVYYKH
jgi:hypothetical protein